MSRDRWISVWETRLTETRRIVGLGLGPALLVLVLILPAPADMPAHAWLVTGVLLLMATWWVSEALPLAATALVPLALFPLMDVAPIRTVAAPYADPLVFLLLGGLMLGLAMQRCQLHRRVALTIVAVAGERPDVLVAGFMAATAVLSMWISNTATAAMMVPVAVSLVRLVEHSGVAGEEQRRIALALLLGVAFSANIGGMGTLIGTPPNAVLAAYFARAEGREISFAEWMTLGLPVVLIMLPIAWAMLTRIAFPLGRAPLAGIRSLVERELAELGPVTTAERRVALVFLGTALLWLLRPLIETVLPGLPLSDAGIAILATLALFVIPSGSGEPLLVWKATSRLPWEVLILIGGGLSLGTVIEDAGLASWLGEALAVMAGWPGALVLLATILVAMLLSHVMNNTATAATLIPLVAGLAASLEIPALPLAAAVALAASCSFMLPVATPPNAIVHGSGLVPAAEMARAGAMVTLIAVPVLLIASVIVVPVVLG
jgi:solute carrier family 13 (sodium-dependent dicarboxylate transporter), member 2/3/5